MLAVAWNNGYVAGLYGTWDVCCIKTTWTMRILYTLAFGCCALLTQAQSVSLSPLFGNNGAVRTPVLPGYNDANAHAITADGKLLLAGDGFNNGDNNSHVSLVRLDTTCGALDTTFGIGGKIGHIHQQRTFCTDIAMQPDGKIVGCGTIAAGNGTSQHAVLQQHQWRCEQHGGHALHVRWLA